VLQAILRHSRAYDLSRRLIGADREMHTVVQSYIRPTPGLDLLDIGCGNGRLLPFLPGVNYVGIDHNASYIETARATHDSSHARFLCGDLGEFPPDEVGPFDVVVSIGVLHHLDDDTVTSALAAAAKRLRPNGRLITMDPCFEPTQRSIARVLMALDRGKFVRHPADYLRLIAPHVGRIEATTLDDVYAFPYTHLVTESRVV
jgi:2-polyprenyl-3-methyl-5-hydroxy-6-metoxy-1,4-benzoquinol methylase